MRTQDEIQWDIDQAVVAAIQSLQLTTVYGVDPTASDAILAKVYSQMYPDPTDLTYPCVIVSQEGEVEERLLDSSEYQEWVYPLRIRIVDSASNKEHGRKRLFLAWRRAIIDKFDSKRLEGVDAVQKCTIIPKMIFDNQLPKYHYIVSPLLLRVLTVEERT